MPVEYEVINKENKEISPVTDFVMGQDFVEVTKGKGSEAEEKIVFSNEGQKGNLLNDTYVIRQVGTQLTPNGEGVVSDEGEIKAISQETRADIDNGEVNPDNVA